jgi:uncharacterized phage protein (TIGR02218 family)
MTDYDDKEKSLSDSAPYELFEFIGTYRNYYMTSDSYAHAFAGNVYNPVPGLSRSSLKVGTHTDSSVDVTIEMPITEQLAIDYGFQTTPPSLKLTIYRFQRDAANYVPYWKGPIAGITINDHMASFKVPSIFSNILSSNIPNVYVQPPCNNVLFDSLCKVSRVSNALDTTVSTVTGRVVTIPSLGAFADGWFIGGEITVPARNERRMIVAQAGTSLTVNYEFSQLPTGTSIQVTAGCDHSYDGANGCPKFSNQPNFGGLPFVPGDSNNVFVKGVG